MKAEIGDLVRFRRGLPRVLWEVEAVYERGGRTFYDLKAISKSSRKRTKRIYGHQIKLVDY